MPVRFAIRFAMPSASIGLAMFHMFVRLLRARGERKSTDSTRPRERITSHQEIEHHDARCTRERQTCTPTAKRDRKNTSRWLAGRLWLPPIVLRVVLTCIFYKPYIQIG